MHYRNTSLMLQAARDAFLASENSPNKDCRLPSNGSPDFFPGGQNLQKRVNVQRQLGEDACWLLDFPAIWAIFQQCKMLVKDSDKKYPFHPPKVLECDRIVGFRNAALRIAWKFILYGLLINLERCQSLSWWRDIILAASEMSHTSTPGSASRRSGSDVDEAANEALLLLLRPCVVDVTPDLLILCISKISRWIWTIGGWLMILRP